MKYFTPIIKINSQLTCNIYIKRDDLLPFSFGGNKVRIAEEFFADMRRKKHDSIIGYGNSRSNLCRVIANMSKYYGVKCCIISPKDDDGQRVETSNSKIVRLCDSEIVICSKDNVSKTVSETISRHKDAGYFPCYIYGNEFGTGNKSTPVNAYYKCYNEILSQAKAYDLDFDYIFLATGTGMTQAGLLSGKLVSNGKEKIVGISVARKTEQETNVIYDYVKSFFKKKQLDTSILNTKGNIYYINDEMSCYRRNAVGSYTTTMGVATVDKRKKYNQGLIDMINTFDKYTDYKYHNYCEQFSERFVKYYYDCLKDEKNFKEIVNKKYRKFFKEESSKDRLYIKLKVYLPFVANLYDKKV